MFCGVLSAGPSGMLHTSGATPYSIMSGQLGSPASSPWAAGDRWFVYVLRCADGSLYTGTAKDVSHRCRQHNAGTASRYTRSRLPAVMVYQEAHANRRLALRREAAIKALSRRQKVRLIRPAG
jgi:predicted GIY-YIG superfamily endonuclease